MEILGIGPGEFVLILIVLLVVVGPERLPGLARSAGQFLVRARNWLQTSPDAALVLRARQEIEAELASIKNSLMEVQVVRDEVMGAAKQLGDSVNSIAPPKLDLNNLVNPPAEQTIAANGQAVSAGETPTLPPDGTPAATTPLDQRSTLELPSSSSAPISPPAEAQPTNGLNSLAHGSSDSKPAIAASAAPALGELESINIRLQAIMADMWALQQQLKQRGALDETWQPPSLDVQLPTPEAIAPAQPASQAEPIEEQVVRADSAPEAAPPPEVGTTIEIATQVTPAEQPVTKTRKRRAATTAEQIQEIAETPANGEPIAKARKRRAAATADPAAINAAEAPANGAPEVKTRKRRTPAASADRSNETEPVTTEKAS